MRVKTTSPKTNTNSEPIRVAIYTRKSTSHGLDQEDNSLDFQREACSHFIEAKRAQGWRVVSKRYDDGGFTGANTDRPALQELLRDAKAGEFEAIIVYKVDRISRSVRDLVLLVEEFQELGIGFASVSQNFDTTTSMGRLILNILGSFGQFERETIAERIRDKIGAARRKGKYVGGKPILGYDIDREKKRLVVNREEAEIVRSIFKAYVEQRSVQPLLVDLNDRGIRTKKSTTRAGKVIGGKQINRQYLTNLLKNRHYLGKVLFKDELFEGEHEGIVDPELFEQAQAILEENKHKDRANLGREQSLVRRDVLLRGLLYCEHSAALMHPTYTVKNGKKYFFYLCSEHMKYGKCACERKRISARRIEREVIEEIRETAMDEPLVRELTKTAKAEFIRLKADLELKDVALRSQRKRLLDKLNYHRRKGNDPDKVTQLEAELAGTDQELVTVTEELEKLEPTFSVTEFRAALRLFEPIWDALPFEDRFRLLELLIERVEYDGNEGKYGSYSIFFRSNGIKSLSQMSGEVQLAS